MSLFKFLIGIALIANPSASNRFNIAVDPVEFEVPNLSLGLSVNALLSDEKFEEIMSSPAPNADTIPPCTSSRRDGPTRNATFPGGDQSNRSTFHYMRNGFNPNYRDMRWYKYGNTYYMAVVLDPSIVQWERDIILAGMRLIEDGTCFKFYIYNEADLINCCAYVKVEKGNGCNSYVGKISNTRQILNLGPGCMTAGIAAHEFLHAVGFEHQQNTPGRNNYVTILEQNIDPNYLFAFDETFEPEHTSFGAPYDYGSIMHYGKDYFSINGRDTIYVKNGASIGQRDRVSQWDKFKVNKMHGCPA